MQAFGDGFDLYANPADMVPGYWDVQTTTSGVTLPAGRFSGSRALSIFVFNSNVVQKSSGANDAVHHINVAFMTTSTIGGTTNILYFQLMDAGNNQCAISFRSDGAILFYGGAPGGTLLATYTGAFTSANAWWSYEFEVVINNTTGSFTVRTNGSPTNSFQATSLNTRVGSTNNYANRIVIGSSNNACTDVIDDFLWRSDPTSVPWVGDIRCYTRMPASDVQKQFTPLSGTTNYTQVAEAQEDAASSYVYSSTVSQSDLYGIAALSGTPASTIAVTTRGFVQKSDAGTRGAAVQLKSGATTVQSTSTLLLTSWGWLYRTDLTDPATGSAWTTTGVNNVTIGPIVTA